MPNLPDLPSDPIADVFRARRKFLDEWIIPFEKCEWLHQEGKGYIVWRRGTGGNIEILHIRAFEEGKGYGAVLFEQMVKKIAHDPPYHTVFGFTRASNDKAQAFYKAMGFVVQRVDGVYADGEAVLVSQEWEQLKRRFGIES